MFGSMAGGYWRLPGQRFWAAGESEAASDSGSEQILYRSLKDVLCEREKKAKLHAYSIKYRVPMVRLSFALCAAVVLGFAGCSPQKAPETKSSVPQYQLTATVQDLMEGLIDPSADGLWDSVAYIASLKGIEDRQPRTAEEWQAVRTSAVNLIEGANLLIMPGRLVAHDPSEKPSQPGPGELSHAEIQKRIDATHEVFSQFARGLQAAGIEALTAIDAKNAQGLMDSGTTIDNACEACHVTYWYPNQRQL